MAVGNLLQRLDAVGNVSHDADEHRVDAGSDLSDGQLDRYFFPVLSERGDFPAYADDLRLTRIQVIFNVAIVLRTIRLGHEHRDVSADNLVTFVAEDLLDCRVDGHDHALPVDRDDRIDNALEDRV